MSAAVSRPVEEISSMIEGEIDFCREWGGEKVREWVNWFIGKGRYLAVSSHGKLSGITRFRMVDKEDAIFEHYRDTGGKICYIEVSVSLHPMGLRAMYDMLWHRHGEDAEKMAWVRHKKNNRVIMVDMLKAKRRFMR